jgi:SAM-dependent methyltransferase
MSNKHKLESVQSWDTYWQGTGDVAAFNAGGVSHPAITEFWNELFVSYATRGQKIELLDLATGNGALLELATSILDADATTMTCVDYSAAAIDNVGLRFPLITGIVADALSLPMDSEQYDLVTSQFGVEYAGFDAINEAARMVAPGGSLALMLHTVDGVVHHECQESLTAIEKLQVANFVPLAIDFFRNGFAAVRGSDRRPYDEAGTLLAPAVQAAENILKEHGEGVAGDMISRLYADVAKIHSNLTKYDPDEVHDWLVTNDRELIGYAGRMNSMMNAALSADDFRVACEQLLAAGLTLVHSGPLTEKAQGKSLGWILVATR